jgi:putative salt-induced outer membrane protein YdiY
MKFSLHRHGPLLALCGLAGLAGVAQAQVTIQPDGQWRHLVSAGLNLNKGNTQATTLNLSSDSVRATDVSKWSASGLVLYATSAGTTTGERFAVSTQFNGDIEPWRSSFGFVQAAALRDRPANTQERIAISSGLGLHLMKRPDEFWDVWAGASVSNERFGAETEVLGAMRQSYSDVGLVLAEECNLVLAPGTKLHQKLTLLPSVRGGGLARTEFETQLAVAISARLNLSAGLNLRRVSHPAPGQVRLDTALVTGLSLRFD